MRIFLGKNSLLEQTSLKEKPAVQLHLIYRINKKDSLIVSNPKLSIFEITKDIVCPKQVALKHQKQSKSDKNFIFTSI